MSDTVLTIEHKALTTVPVWEDHRRGKNWMAMISIDPEAPGGLSRTFAKKARGEFYYMVPDWAGPGVAVEFGADYYSCGGRPSRTRWYGVILEAGESKMTLEACESGKDAIKRAAEIRDEREANPDPYELSHVPTHILEAEIRRRQEQEWSAFPKASNA